MKFIYKKESNKIFMVILDKQKRLWYYYLRCLSKFLGEVSEWFKELVLKTSDSERDRGFESLPLRHF